MPAAHVTPVAAVVLETSGKAAATIEASSGPPAAHASGALRANGATQSRATGAPPSAAQQVLGAPATPLTRSAATPPTRAVAYAWLKERRAKQEAAVIEATVLLEGDATGAAAAASLNAAMISCGEVGRWAQALALYERMAAGGVSWPCDMRATRVGGHGAEAIAMELAWGGGGGLTISSPSL